MTSLVAILFKHLRLPRANGFVRDLAAAQRHAK
jgi:hypothetical protein